MPLPGGASALPQALPLLPQRASVLLPHGIMRLKVDNARDVALLEAVAGNNAAPNAFGLVPVLAPGGDKDKAGDAGESEVCVRARVSCVCRARAERASVCACVCV